MRSLPVVLAAVALGVLPGCNESESVRRAQDRTIEPLEADALPAELVGLRLKAENITDVIESTKRPYLTAAALYSLREEDELQATLQIGEFADDADHEDDDFRATLLQTVGAGSIREFQVGGESVYLTTGDRQQVAVWFQEEHIFILSTREDFGRSRALLRHALELEL